jgi:hypothetical protein
MKAYNEELLYGSDYVPVMTYRTPTKENRMTRKQQKHQMLLNVINQQKQSKSRTAPIKLFIIRAIKAILQ